MDHLHCDGVIHLHCDGVLHLHCDGVSHLHCDGVLHLKSNTKGKRMGILKLSTIFWENGSCATDYSFVFASITNIHVCFS